MFKYLTVFVLILKKSEKMCVNGFYETDFSENIQKIKSFIKKK